MAQQYNNNYFQFSTRTNHIKKTPIPCLPVDKKAEVIFPGPSPSEFQAMPECIFFLKFLGNFLRSTAQEMAHNSCINP